MELHKIEYSIELHLEPRQKLYEIPVENLEFQYKNIFKEYSKKIFNKYLKKIVDLGSIKIVFNIL